MAGVYRKIQDNRGIALVEFAIVLPVLLLFFAGSIELARYVLFKEKLNSTVMQMLGIINQSKSPDSASMDNLYSVLPAMMDPFKIPGAYRIVTTHIVNPAGGESDCKAVVLWKYPREPIEGGVSPKSVTGSPVALSDFKLLAGDSVMLIEASVPYRPMFAPQVAYRIIGKNPRVYVYMLAHSRYGQFNIDPLTKQYVSVINPTPNPNCIKLARSPTGPKAAP